MKLSDFDFHLPQDRIAQQPAPIRDQSRLMVVNRATGAITHDIFSNLPKYLVDHPLMVFNNTRVIPARLRGQIKGSGREVELLLTRKIKPPDTWEAMIKGLGRLKTGTEIIFAEGKLTGVLMDRKGERGILRLSCSENTLSVLDEIADMPLPPYIHRGSQDNSQVHKMDRERYQTVYAAREGAIAAPTAGFHFTQNLLDEIGAGRADLAFLTLHVGPGTFLPIREEDITRHKMEPEFFHISRETFNRIREAKRGGQRILSVGTTTTRTLESINLEGLVAEDVSGWTDRFIFPGQRFRTIDQLLTNFHLPKSTLFLLVCAFSGRDLMLRAYQEAIQNNYRFFSYGDSMLIL
ncbi:MAG: tRNA preQ1(34) S-adenosylmethionine ribosyltransferase-isomerase QueA [Nitrospinaceae bacterium]